MIGEKMGAREPGQRSQAPQMQVVVGLGRLDRNRDLVAVFVENVADVGLRADLKRPVDLRLRDHEEYVSLFFSHVKRERILQSTLPGLLNRRNLAGFIHRLRLPLGHGPDGRGNRQACE